jgi:hypothetical protein
MFKSLLLAASILVGATTAMFGQITTTVDWTNVSGDTSFTLFNKNDVALSAGTASVNQDGDLIQLGYFSAASVGHEFSGTFIPLTTTTTIGDSYNLEGVPAGEFGFNSYFVPGTTSYVYDPGVDSGAYTTTSATSISTTNPAADQILAIRFFSTNLGTSGYYNTVTADSWQWQVPTESGATVSINLVTTGAGNLLWQDAANPYITSIAVAVPEPANLALLGGVVIGAMFLRKNREVQKRGI